MKEQLSAIGVNLREANDIIGLIKYEYWMSCANMQMIPDENQDFTLDWEGVVRVTGNLVKNGANVGHVAYFTIKILNIIPGVPNDMYEHWEAQITGE